MSGLFLAAAGFLRLGTYIKFIPYPVTVGFTAGIAAIIFASQIKDLVGLELGGAEPGEFLAKLPVLWRALPTANVAAIGISAGVIAAIVLIRRLRPHWPAMLIAVVGAALASTAIGLDVATIGTRFGTIPSALPAPHLPAISLAKIVAVLPDALAFTLLGAIESLLSAVVADGMTGRRHRSNCELVAQGAANIASSLFGGLVVTGAIARTATNVRAGAHGPVAGMFHAVFLLLFMALAAPLASYVPLAALAGVLAVVAWNMAERHAFFTLVRASRGDAAVLLATFLLTIFRDLSTGIVVGFALGSLLFIHRMSQSISVESEAPLAPEDVADTAGGERAPYDATKSVDPDILVYRISGAFFFGAASAVGSVLERISDGHRALIVDFSAVPFLDSTAASTIAGLARRAKARGVATLITGANADVKRELSVHGASALIDFRATIGTAIAAFRAKDGANGAKLAAHAQP
jgi:SulP family sulfate permease